MSALLRGIGSLFTGPPKQEPATKEATEVEGSEAGEAPSWPSEEGITPKLEQRLKELTL